MATSRLIAALVGAWALAAFACSDREAESGSNPPGSTTVVVPSVARDGTDTASPPPSASPTSPQTKPPGPAPTPRAGQNDLDGPWNRDLRVAFSSDGLSMGQASSFIERAGVPCVIRDSGERLVAVFQWFPFDDAAAFDRVAVAFSTDGGTSWSKPARMSFSGLPSNLMRPFDPTVVQLGDGRYRLYFTSNEQGGGGRPAIYSAISNDAVNYTFEAGARFAPAGGTVDAAAVWFGEKWHLFSHTAQAGTGKGYHAVSADGLLFEELAQVDVGSGRQWIGNAVVTGGVLRYYGSGRDGIWSATSADGAAWTLDNGSRANGGDPSGVWLADGRLMLVFVGELRSDAGPRPN